jgi:DNA polymerase I-like protein with 3'-5' exonuclease and polymerase domains
MLDDLYRESRPKPTYQPEPPPSLDGITDIVINAETARGYPSGSALHWWDKARPIATSYSLPDGRTGYLSWGHRAGGNGMTEDQAREWHRKELRGKNITNVNTRFDVHQYREWGVDLEALGCTVTDVAHHAALLDDHRRGLSLDDLITDFLGGITVKRLDESKMEEYHAGETAARSQYNVWAVRALRDYFAPQLAEQNLLKVKALEDKVIFVVCEMEKNGVPIDEELLHRWLKESEQEYLRTLWMIQREVGFVVNPNSDKDMLRVFQQLHLPVTRLAPTPRAIAEGKQGSPSFTGAILRSFNHPILELCLKALRIASLRSLYLVKIRDTMCSNGILRYALHQLRAVKDPNAVGGEDSVGTVSGRFSSTAIDKKRNVGLNAQQFIKVAKQRTTMGYDEEDSSHDDVLYIVRQLVIPDRKHKPRANDWIVKWLSGDAQQIEYRLFANYTGNKGLQKAYEENPNLSFHKHMHKILKGFKESVTYRQAKDLSFAQIYGAGTTKLALMMGFISQSEFLQIRENRDFNNPKLAPAKEIKAIYDRLMPEVKPLLEKAGHLAAPECHDRCKPGDRLHQKYQHRGFVTTLLGRRSRFPDGNRLHKAFNCVDQGGAADINKQKLVELHAERNYTDLLLRLTVHDEVDGDAREPHTEERVREILNRQSFPELKIPILWDVGVGENWAEAH